LNTADDCIHFEKGSAPFARLYYIGESGARITAAKNGLFEEAAFADQVLLPHPGSSHPVAADRCAGPAGGGSRAGGGDRDGGGSSGGRTGCGSDGTGCDSVSGGDGHEDGENGAGDGTHNGGGEGDDDAGSIQVEYDSPEERFSFYDADGGCFLRLRIGQQGGGARPVLDIETSPGEGFYGFGEWFNGFRRESGSLELYNREAPSFLQGRRTYSAFPCFLSDRGWLILVLNSHRGRVDINRPDGRLRLRFRGGGLDFVVIRGPSFKRILRDYTRLTGRPPLVPAWCFGLWNTAFPVENQEKTLDRVKRHRERRIPLDAVILDYHWEEGFHNFQWRLNLFPDPADLIRRLDSAGVKLGLIYTPYINRRALPLIKPLVRLLARNAPRGVPLLSKDDAAYEFRKAEERGFLAARRVTWWLGRGGALDFTNPEAADWWFSLQEPLLDQGVRFFKNDGGEYLPEGSTSAGGLDPGEFHNIYCFYYSRAVYEKTREYLGGEKRPLVFSRTAWAGSQRFPAVFLGDQTPKYRHIRGTMRCGLNMSLLGFAYWGADVFGLFRKPSAELHKRYAQWALFNPIARYFSSPRVAERDPWGIDASCEVSFRLHLKLRMRLLPYYYRLAREAFDTGLPILRPLCLEFQEDPETKGIWGQAMLGDALMLAPVLRRGSTTREIYFPEGRWYSWWDDTEYTGPARRDVQATETRLPLFARGGRPIFLGPVLQSIPDSHRFSSLELHLYPPFEGEAALYEDDATSLDYLGGRYAFQRFRCVKGADRDTVSVRFEPVEGRFDGQPDQRKITVFLHRAGRPRSIDLRSGGAKEPDSVPEHGFDPRRGLLTVRFDIRCDEENELRIRF